MPPKEKRKKSRRGKRSIPTKLDLHPEMASRLAKAWENLAGSEESFPSKQVRKMMMQSLDLEPTEIKELFDENGKDTLIQRDEFQALAGKVLQQKEKAMMAFQLFDSAGKGVVILEDLQRVATDLGEDLSREELNEMITFVDQSEDGMLTTEDFLTIVKAVNL